MLLLQLSSSVISDSVTPWTVAHEAPLSTGFPRQEYWSGLPFPSPRDLPNPGVQTKYPALAGGFFTTEPSGKLQYAFTYHQNNTLGFVCSPKIYAVTESFI